MLKLFSVGSNEHVAHEESMVGTRAYDSDPDSVFFIPSCKTIYNIDAVSCVEVINGSLSVDPPDL